MHPGPGQAIAPGEVGAVLVEKLIDDHMSEGFGAGEFLAQRVGVESRVKHLCPEYRQSRARTSLQAWAKPAVLHELTQAS